MSERVFGQEEEAAVEAGKQREQTERDRKQPRRFLTGEDGKGWIHLYSYDIMPIVRLPMQKSDIAKFGKQK